MITLKCFSIHTGTRFIIVNFKDTPDQELLDLCNYIVKRGWYPFNNMARFEIPKKLTSNQFEKLFAEENIQTKIEEIQEFQTSTQLINNLFQSCDEEIVSFGKYKGQPWSDMPIDYLLWLIQNSEHEDIVEHAKAVYRNISLKKQTTAPMNNSN